MRYASLSSVHEVTTSPLLDDGGAVQGVVVTLKDVSPRRDQQERFLRSARLADIGQLAAGVAHEINTPAGLHRPARGEPAQDGRATRASSPSTPSRTSRAT